MDQRTIAYECLCAVMIRKEYSNLTLRHALRQVEGRKRPYITQLFYGTLENYRCVRYQWEDLVAKQPKDSICVLMDMAVYELLWMHTKPYALINETIKLAKGRFASASGMINALLRKVEQRGKRDLPKDGDEALSIQTSHPLWLIRMWNAQYGKAVCEQICKADMLPRKGCGRVNTLKTSRAELLKRDPRFSCGSIGNDSITYDQGNLADTMWYQNGWITIQDKASQLVAPFLDPQPLERILDVCSAPGTKATHMAQLMNNQGEILCGDIHPHRVALIEEGAKRMGITCIKAKCMDATRLSDLKEGSFDRVLCDVPCSGYGTLSRKSDIKYHMQSSDMDTLIPLQASILARSCQMVKPNGYLVYSTCTLNKKENEKQIASFLKAQEQFILVKEQTIFPFAYGSDGFYMAKLKRISSK